ncbi:hypothetical protein EVAR_34330_1 [Eumeta japonica]|uniref:Uncharacterized protein n=1 Tax=Eumeta variegata TaxID=151549 RepID=A0A4C1VEC1_EUMVA|nr:hypothetical protein EVAR_34330_1 [Eumeta japonica]
MKLGAFGFLCDTTNSYQCKFTTDRGCPCDHWPAARRGRNRTYYGRGIDLRNSHSLDEMQQRKLLLRAWKYHSLTSTMTWQASRPWPTRVCVTQRMWSPTETRLMDSGNGSYYDVPVKLLNSYIKTWRRKRESESECVALERMRVVYLLQASASMIANGGIPTIMALTPATPRQRCYGSIAASLSLCWVSKVTDSIAEAFRLPVC